MLTLRPAFELTVSLEQEEAIERIRRWSSDPACACGIMTTASQVDVLVPEARRHVWSPWLSMKAVPHASGGTRLYGRFAPHPNIWTLFMSAYALMAFVAIMGACWGLAQITLGQSAWAFWGVPGACLGAGGLYYGSRVGQRLGHGQMDELRGCIGALFEDEVIDPDLGVCSGETHIQSAADEPHPPSTPTRHCP
ncbi:MAG: hypothetical protein ACE366_10350 [Bradymonadia bacterium]